MPIAADSGKVPGPPGTQDHVPKQQCQDRGHSVIAVSRIVCRLGVILVTALEKQSELGEKKSQSERLLSALTRRYSGGRRTRKIALLRTLATVNSSHHWNMPAH